MSNNKRLFENVWSTDHDICTCDTSPFHLISYDADKTTTATTKHVLTIVSRNCTNTLLLSTTSWLAWTPCGPRLSNLHHTQSLRPQGTPASQRFHQNPAAPQIPTYQSSGRHKRSQTPDRQTHAEIRISGNWSLIKVRPPYGGRQYVVNGSARRRRRRKWWCIIVINYLL